MDRHMWQDHLILCSKLIVEQAKRYTAGHNGLTVCTQIDQMTDQLQTTQLSQQEQGKLHITIFVISRNRRDIVYPHVRQPVCRLNTALQAKRQYLPAASTSKQIIPFDFAKQNSYGAVLWGSIDECTMCCDRYIRYHHKKADSLFF